MGTVTRTFRSCFLPCGCTCWHKVKSAESAVFMCMRVMKFVQRVERAVYEVITRCSCSAAIKYVVMCHSTLCSCVCDLTRVSLQDFRDAVAKATRQNGKLVVDERILNQILYYLPQLYQLNRDLLRELEERVAHWYTHTHTHFQFSYIRSFINKLILLSYYLRHVS